MGSKVGRLVINFLDSNCLLLEVEFTNAFFPSDTNDEILNLFLSAVISVGAAEVLGRVDNNCGQSGLLGEVVERLNLGSVIRLVVGQVRSVFLSSVSSSAAALQAKKVC